MEYRWDLKELYVSKEAFYYDMTLIHDKVKKICVHREIKIDGNSLYNLMNDCFEIREINSKTLLYASLNYYLDINNDSYIKMKEQAEELDNFVLNEISFIDELIAVLDDDKLSLFYVDEPNLIKYKFYIDNVRRGKQHLVNNNSMVSYLKMINTNLVKYNSLIKDMDFGCIEENRIDNSNVGLFLVHENRDIRREVFNNLNSSYILKKNDYFNLFSDIISLRKKISFEKKYSSVLEEELFKDDIGFKYVDNLIEGVNNNIGIMNRYLKLKCDYLGVDKPKLYDINLSIVNNNNIFNVDKALDIIKDALGIFGKEYIAIINNLIDNNHLDLESDHKKHPSITFSWNTYCFTNYKERYIDIKNLAHELGHVVNSYLSLKKQPYIYSDSTVFTGEVAALVNEIILNDYLYKNSSSKNDKVFYLTKIIENFTSQVFRQTMYTEFERIIYEKDNLDLEFVCQSYLDLINKYYGKVIEIDNDINIEWMRIGHLFRWSYYVYKYASGYILAFNIIDKIKEDKKLYIEFLESGCSCSNEELLKKMDIDLYDIGLVNNSLKILNYYIDELEALLKK